MPVLDASVVVEYLAGGRARDQAAEAIFGDSRTRWVPHLLDAEVGHVLRRTASRGELDDSRAATALRHLRGLPIVRAAQVGLLDRAWEFRGRITFYDALYVALAERIGGELITIDARLARPASEWVDVVVLDA